MKRGAKKLYTDVDKGMFLFSDLTIFHVIDKSGCVMKEVFFQLLELSGVKLE